VYKRRNYVRQWVHAGSEMNGSDLVSWRKNLKLTQQEAAEKLGISRGTLADYERGIRRSDNKNIDVPKAIELACQAIKLGFESYSSSGYFVVEEKEISDFVLWSLEKIRQPEKDILRSGRNQFPGEWNDHPFAFVPHRKYMSPQAREALQEEMSRLHGIDIKWQMLPIASHEKGWKLFVPVILAEDMNEIAVLALKFREPVDR
jgi:transcriptional regulator with XRE-family HTH domain